MTQIILGLVLLLLGLWGIVSHWYQFVDLLWVIVPMALLLGGVGALLGGIGSYSKRSSALARDPGKSKEG
jgi:hypothetical protein